jgi:hypothetical protein
MTCQVFLQFNRRIDQDHGALVRRHGPAAPTRSRCAPRLPDGAIDLWRMADALGHAEFVIY